MISSLKRTYRKYKAPFLKRSILFSPYFST
jgi:hypothetical protein